MTFSVPATKPPIDASDLEKVPTMRSTSSDMPKCAAVPVALGAEHADRVGVVQGQGGAVLAGPAATSSGTSAMSPSIE